MKKTEERGQNNAFIKEIILSHFPNWDAHSTANSPLQGAKTTKKYSGNYSDFKEKTNEESTACNR